MGVRKWLPEDRSGMGVPACSATALRKMGFAQSLHCTIPISEVLLRGSAPNIFMSRAESHEVGGGKAAKEEGGEGGGGLERDLNERGAGDGVGECLSLRTAMMEKARDNTIRIKGSTLINYVTSAHPPPNPLVSRFYHSTLFSPYFYGS